MFTGDAVFLFFKQKTAYEIKEYYWSSDVCSSDLCTGPARSLPARGGCSTPRSRLETPIATVAARARARPGANVSPPIRYFGMAGCRCPAAGEIPWPPVGRTAG